MISKDGANYVEVNDSVLSDYTFDTTEPAADNGPRDYIRVVAKVLAEVELDVDDRLDLLDLINYLVDQLERVKAIPGMQLPFYPLPPVNAFPPFSPEPYYVTTNRGT